MSRYESWGRYPRAQQRRVLPAFWRGDPPALDPADAPYLPYGLGRSYGDCCLNADGTLIDARPLSRFIAFDAQAGRLTCEAGVSLEQIINAFAPRGWFPPITPGTKYVTLGGCVANDIHGKAHRSAGCFARCVTALTVLLADGRVLRATRSEHAELFWACFGGLGLLGVILEVTLRLRRIETTYFHQRAITVRDLGELLEAFDRFADQPYSVAWIDPLATGAALGRGVLTVGDHAARDALTGRLRADPLRITPPPRLEVPFDMPGWALNEATIRVLNVVLGTMQARAGALAHYEKFLFPLDFIGQWNRGYGRRGFTQYQFVIPLEDGAARMRALLELIARSGQSPFLNVLKKFGPEDPRTQLSFPREGYTFAIDFPVRPGLPELLQRLDARVLDAGGRIYLGKDAFVAPETLAAMYPKLDEWRAIKARYDPEQRLRSCLSDRVGLTARA
ncbi:MAG: FAD-binding oxidoreductase [Myxococcales bacterium]|nr:FAD-binding oxidoreductase [Myxococcales bacterium]